MRQCVTFEWGSSASGLWGGPSARGPAQGDNYESRDSITHVSHCQYFLYINGRMLRSCPVPPDTLAVRQNRGAAPCAATGLPGRPLTLTVSHIRAGDARQTNRTQDRTET